MRADAPPLAPDTESYPHTYRFCGLNVASRLDLGLLPPLEGQADVRIRLGQLPNMANRLTQILPWLSQAAEEAVLQFGSTRYHVADGKDITVDAEDSSSVAVRWRLLGLGFGVLLHQRRMLALHATVVGINGSSVAIVGQSGAGKSTLAAALTARGHPLLADDLCAITFADGRVWVEPGPGSLRLWGDSVDALVMANATQLDVDIEKYELPTDLTRLARTPLDALVTLDDGPEMTLVPLDVGARFSLAVTHTYCRACLDTDARRAHNFSLCGELARRVAGYRLTRPRSYLALPEATDLVEVLLNASATSD